jgi:hypothetical protein
MPADVAVITTFLLIIIIIFYFLNKGLVETAISTLYDNYKVKMWFISLLYRY